MLDRRWVLVAVVVLVLTSLQVVALPTSAAEVSLNLRADLNGWVGEDGSLNPTVAVATGDNVTVTITWVNSVHNWALYAGGTPPGNVSHGGPNAIVRTADVWSSSPTATARFTPSGPATYEYYCEYHPFSMHGKLVVQSGGASSGTFPNRTFRVARSPPGGPKSDTVKVDILPTRPGNWWVSGETIAGAAVLVEVLRTDGTTLTLVSSSKVREAGQESRQTPLVGGQAYVAAFTPFGKAGTSALREHFQGPSAPAARFTYTPSAPTTDDLVAFNASGSTDPDNDIASYGWDFGDGTTATGVMAAHRFSTATTYTVTLRVIDATGLTGVTSRDIAVQKPRAEAPVASFTVTRNLMVVTTNASSSFGPGGTIVDHHWIWGDGTEESTGTTPTALHTYANPGKYTITLGVTDDAGAVATAAREVTVNTTTIDWTFYDFFNVPFRDWWNYRTAVYNEHPIGAECFSASGIANGICSPSQPDVPDVATYPYTDWSALPTARNDYSSPDNNPYIYAPYRIRVTGVNVPGYNLAEPVFLPVLNYGQPVGSRLEFNWSMQFLDTATAEDLGSKGCPISSSALDGFHIRSQIELILDMQQSRRMFNVNALDPADAQRWWDSNTNVNCYAEGPAEAALESWFLGMGGSAFQVGKYDIYNSYEWFWDPVYTDMHARVDPDGTTHVFVDNVAWGTGVLLARMFYWGNASYAQNYLDSTKAKGWAGMELVGWFEDFSFSGSLNPTGFNFDLGTVVTYHLVHLALPGPDGFLNQVDDVPVWTWRPILQDYLNDFAPRHLLSELDRYPGLADVHSTPGGSNYNRSLPYDYVPIRWDLPVGQTWHFQLPQGNVMFVNPNLTPVPANPASNDHVKVLAPVRVASMTPDGYGKWDPQAFTWDVVGPAMTGGPAGGPGPDGTPGTADDEYALQSWGSIFFAPNQSAAGPAQASSPSAVADVPFSPNGGPSAGIVGAPSAATELRSGAEGGSGDPTALSDAGLRGGAVYGQGRGEGWSRAMELLGRPGIHEWKRAKEASLSFSPGGTAPSLRLWKCSQAHL